MTQRRNCVIYTSITGRYDSLKPYQGPWRTEADFIAYLDHPLDSDVWQVRPAVNRYADAARNAKYHKITPEDLFAHYDYSVWIDGSVLIKSQQSLQELLAQWLSTKDMALFRHRVRSCIYDEAQRCIETKKDDPVIIQSQLMHYRGLGHPVGGGLNECTVLVRRHSDQMRRFCRVWFGEIERFSKRDQLSFNVVARRLGLDYYEIPGNIMENDHFLWVYHDPDGGPIVPVR